MKKQPKQKRSQVVVNSVLEAATRILMNYRLNETSTNKIADVAGVGIGSLYDYFPNKEDIAIALVDQRLDKLTKDFKAILKNSSGTIEDLIDDCVNYIEEAFLKRRGFLHEIFLLAPKSGRMEAIYEARRESVELIEDCLVKQHHKDRPWARIKAFFVMNAVMGTLEAYVILEDRGFSPETVKAELRGLMLGVLNDTPPELPTPQQ